jgi:hypothetical protein
VLQKPAGDHRGRQPLLTEHRLITSASKTEKFMKDVLIIGGGFAGVWCAAGVVRTARAAGDPGDALRVT